MAAPPPTGKREVVAKGWWRRTARAKQRRLERLQARAGDPLGTQGDRALATLELRKAGVPQAAIEWASFKVQRASRIKARWEVVAEW